MWRKAVPAVTAAGLVAGLAGCASSSKVTAPTSVPITSASPNSTSATPAAAPGTVSTANSRYGTILVANGRTLYLLTSDSPTASTCTSGDCVAVWPPLTGSATAGPGVAASKLGHVAGPNGARQVTYGGHPLYFYVGDGGSGQVNGQAITSFGGTWYVVSASTGGPATRASGTGPTTTKGGSGSGY